MLSNLDGVVHLPLIPTALASNCVSTRDNSTSSRLKPLRKKYGEKYLQESEVLARGGDIYAAPVQRSIFEK